MDLLNEELRLLIESLAEGQTPISIKDADESIGKGLMSLEIPFKSGAIFRIFISKKNLKKEIEDARRKEIQYWRGPGKHLDEQRPQDAMQLLLSGVDKVDTIKTFDRFLDCQNFLRLELRSLDIMYDQTRFKFLPKVPVYSLDTKRFGDTSFKTEELWEKESCWRMAHIDYAHISDGMLYCKKNTKNFFKYGFREGMSLSECRDRYQQGYGDEGWSHPHFIPGLFIAMSQTYQRHQYRRWARGNSGKRDHKGKTNDTRDMYDDEQGGALVSPNGIPESYKSRSVPADHTDSTWQILLTDGPNDQDFAHLYTTNVPSFIIASFASPSKLHFSVPPTETQQNSAAGCGSESGEKKECEYEDASFDFLICHTKIAYEPQNTFRQRLREAITFARDSYRYQRKDTCLSVSYADKCLQSPEEMFLRREWEAQMNVYWEKTTQKMERRTFVSLAAFLRWNWDTVVGSVSYVVAP
ncbi:hypothetical protein NUW58_g760 [Xylaria curta]|uniref:Uncharacterized protein n=1 Tax=Xylaria curta TaxID=42375 RepID=A0ACC1PQZ2_9PEZI|nr:hypothetical protein NUW58_g760 [Xylaria curta]